MEDRSTPAQEQFSMFAHLWKNENMYLYAVVAGMDRKHTASSAKVLSEN